MATPETTTRLSIGLHSVSELRWPKQPLIGDGAREITAVPLPRLPWSDVAVDVPLGATAARAVERVTRLRRIFSYGVVPVIVLIFVVADVILLLGRFEHLHPNRSIFGYAGLIGVPLILTGLLPNVVARATGTPYVSRSELRFPVARADIVQQVIRLNPKAAIETR
jgi:hypothetical protein